MTDLVKTVLAKVVLSRVCENDFIFSPNLKC